MENTESKVNITLQTTEGNVPEVIIRHGEAPEVKYPKPINLVVTMPSINEWVKARTFKSTPQENTGVIIFCKNPEKASLEFYDNPNDKDATILTSRLKLNPDMLAFGINKDKYFSQKDLEKHIRKYAHCFIDEATVLDLIKRLQTFEVSYNQSYQKADDRQGNKGDSYKEAIKFSSGELPKTLNLKMPLYENTESVEFAVEIEIEKMQGSNMPSFGFYSLQLETMIRNMAISIVEGQVTELKKTFVCLEQ